MRHPAPNARVPTHGITPGDHPTTRSIDPLSIHPRLPPRNSLLHTPNIPTLHSNQKCPAITTTAVTVPRELYETIYAPGSLPRVQVLFAEDRARRHQQKQQQAQPQRARPTRQALPTIFWGNVFGNRRPPAAAQRLLPLRWRLDWLGDPHSLGSGS